MISSNTSSKHQWKIFGKQHDVDFPSLILPITELLILAFGLSCAFPRQFDFHSECQSYLKIKWDWDVFLFHVLKCYYSLWNLGVTVPWQAFRRSWTPWSTSISLSDPFFEMRKDVHESCFIHERLILSLCSCSINCSRINTKSWVSLFNCRCIKSIHRWNAKGLAIKTAS